MTEHIREINRTVIAISNGHRWVPFDKWVACRDCGKIRRADDNNPPCKGAVKVVPRTPTLELV